MGEWRLRGRDYNTNCKVTLPPVGAAIRLLFTPMCARFKRLNRFDSFEHLKLNSHSPLANILSSKTQHSTQHKHSTAHQQRRSARCAQLSLYPPSPPGEKASETFYKLFHCLLPP